MEKVGAEGRCRHYAFSYPHSCPSVLVAERFLGGLGFRRSGKLDDDPLE